MTDQHEWPTAPIIEAAWVTPIFEETALTGIWTRVRDGIYYSTYRGYVARKGEGYFANVTEYWPRDYRKDEVQRLQRALTERNITIAGLWKELEQHGESCCAPDPTTFVLPPEPEGPIWDKNGTKWVHTSEHTWMSPAATAYTWPGLLDKFGPLTSTPPANQAWRIGDTISQGDDLRALPTGTILRAEHKTMAGKIVHKIGSRELEVTGIRGSTYPACIRYPLTIIWLPDTKKEEAE